VLFLGPSSRAVRRSPLRFAAALAAAALVLGACSGGGDSAEDGVAPTTSVAAESGESPSTVADSPASPSGPSRGGTLTVLIQEDPSPIVGWTPWDHVCAWGCRNVLDQVLETLTVVLPDGSIEPWLAESVTPNEQLTEWTVVLRDGVTFSDGQPMTATNIKRGHDDFVQNGKATEGLLRDARIVGLEVIDERTLVYELSAPNAGLPAALAGPAGRVFSVDAAYANPAAFLRAPVGSGPFVFESWELGEDAELRANPDYWRSGADGERLPLVDRVVFRHVGDEEDRLQQLVSGDGQVSQTRAPRAVQQARELNLTVVPRVEDNIGAVVFNTLEPPYDDARVRRALLLATDQAALLDASGVGDVSPAATQWWSPDSIWYSERAAESWPTSDIEEARRLLDEYITDPLRTDEEEEGSPLALRVQCTDDLQLSNMARELERQWETTGVVDVEIEIVSRSGLIQRVVGAVTDRPSFSGDFTVTCWRLGGESDPWALLSTALGPVKTSPFNVANLEEERLSELVTLVQTSANEATRHAAIEQIMLVFALEVPAIYLGHATTAVIGSDEVRGLGVWTLPDGREFVGHVGGVGRYAEVWRP